MDERRWPLLWSERQADALWRMACLLAIERRFKGKQLVVTKGDFEEAKRLLVAIRE